MDVQTLLEERRHEADSRRLKERLDRMRSELREFDLVVRPSPPPATPAVLAADSDWLIRLRPLKSFGAPPVCRMKRLLKAALRAFGFRAVFHKQVQDGPQDGPETGQEADETGA